MYVRWTSFSCPSCGTHYDSRIVTSARVGVEEKECKKCGFTYRTIDREWKNMTKWQRIGYFLSMWTVAWLIFFAACGLAAYDEDHPWTRLYGLAVGILVFTPVWIVKIARVKQSLRRFPLAS